MRMTEMFLRQLDAEVERSKRALEQVPEGQYAWKPHAKSMPFGYLVAMVASVRRPTTSGSRRLRLEEVLCGAPVSPAH